MTDPAYGVVTWIPGVPVSYEVRAESDGRKVVATFAAPGITSPAVSPDGRRIAYWAGPGSTELWISEVAAPGRAQMVTSIAPRSPGGVVWSTDGTGLLITTHSKETEPGPEGAPLDSTVAGVDVGTRRLETLVTGRNAFRLPLAWDRAAGIVAASGGIGQKGTGEYIASAEGRARFWSPLPDATRNDVLISSISVSSDARFAMAVWNYGSTPVLRYWPVDDLSAYKELRVAPGESVRTPIWRPGTHEIAANVNGMLEIWELDGGRRRVGPLPSSSATLMFRHDGSAVYASVFASVRTDLIDMRDGAAMTLPDIPNVAASVRLR